MHNSILLWLYGRFYEVSVTMTFTICSTMPSKLEIDGILFAMFFIKTLRYDCCCVPIVVHLCEFQINNFSKHIPVNSIKFEYVSTEQGIFCDKRYLKYMKQNMQD